MVRIYDGIALSRQCVVMPFWAIKGKTRLYETVCDQPRIDNIWRSGAAAGFGFGDFGQVKAQ